MEKYKMTDEELLECILAEFKDDSTFCGVLNKEIMKSNIRYFLKQRKEQIKNIDVTNINLSTALGKTKLTNIREYNLLKSIDLVSI